MSVVTHAVCESLDQAGKLSCFETYDQTSMRAKYFANGYVQNTWVSEVDVGSNLLIIRCHCFSALKATGSWARSFRVKLLLVAAASEFLL